MKKQILVHIYRHLNVSIFIALFCGLNFYGYFYTPIMVYFGFKVYKYFMKNYGFSAIKIRVSQFFNLWNLTIKQIGELMAWSMKAYIIYAFHYAAVILFVGLIH